MPTTNSTIQFKHGLQETFSNITKDSNTIYFITDTNRLFVGDSEYTRPVQHGSELPTSKNPANSLFVKETGTSCELYYSKDGTAWDMIAYLPATITGGVFGDNTAGTVAYGGTIKVPKVTVDNRGYVTAAEDVTLTLPTSDKVTTVTTSGDGNAVTGGSISDDGATLTLTKGESFIPASGGTFTGAVTLAGAPTTDLNAATKKYVDDSISSAVSASDAMVFKGTVGTSGTVASISAMDYSTAATGDTYKVIKTDTLPAANSSDSSEHDLTPGDLIVYMGEDKFIYVPSGDEDVTSVKIADSDDTINVSTIAQTGNLILGTAAGVNTTLTVTDDSTTVPTTAAVKTYVDNAESLAMPKTGGTFTGDVKVANNLTTKTFTINPEDRTDITTNGQIHDISTLTFANDNRVNNNNKFATIVAQYSASVVGSGTHVGDSSTLKLQAGTVQLADLAIYGSSCSYDSRSVTLEPQHNIPTDREQKVDPESIVMTYVIGQHEGQHDYTTISLKASYIFAQGQVSLYNEPTQYNHAATKRYVDTVLSNMTDTKVTTVTTTGNGNVVTGGSISNDGTILTLTKGESFIPASGGTFTGAVTLAGAPTTDLNAATKKYVDDTVAAATLTWKTF